MRLLRANLRRLLRRPATWVTLGLLVALVVLVIVAIVVAAGEARSAQAALAARSFVTFPAAYEPLVSVILGIGALLAVTYGAAVAGSEWGWGTLKAAVARGEGRARYLLAGYAGATIFAILGFLAAYLVAVTGAAVGAVALGVPTYGMGDLDALARLAELLARAGLAVAMNVAFGYAVATIAGSQLAGIGVAIGLFFAEGIAGIFLPDVVRWLPFASSGAVVAVGDGGGMGGAQALVASLDPATALAATAAWLAGSLVAAVAWTERAEIGG